MTVRVSPARPPTADTRGSQPADRQAPEQPPTITSAGAGPLGQEPETDERGPVSGRDTTIDDSRQEPGNQAEPGANGISNRQPGIPGRRPTHGTYLTQRLGASAISAEAAQAEADLRAALAVPEGVVQALIDRATRGMVVLAVLEAHIEAEVHAGVAFSEVPVAVRWPGFNNSVVRSLQALAQVLPKTTPHEAERQRVVDLLDTLRQARPGTPGASADQQQAQPDESAHEPDGGDCEERDG